MKAYSTDLRERVIVMIAEVPDVTQPEVAEHFQVSLSTVEKWWRRWRETEEVDPLPHRGGAPRTLANCADVIRQAVKQHPDATLEELCVQVQTATGVQASPRMMCRELQLLHLPRKKVPARQPTRHPPRATVAARLSPRRPGTVAPRRRPSEIHR